MERSPHIPEGLAAIVLWALVALFGVESWTTRFRKPMIRA
jgi:hypothetical protein